jgi:hypothetical protein
MSFHPDHQQDRCDRNALITQNVIPNLRLKRVRSANLPAELLSILPWPARQKRIRHVNANAWAGLPSDFAVVSAAEMVVPGLARCRRRSVGK